MEIKIIQPSQIPKEWYNSVISLDVTAESKSINSLIYSVTLAKEGEDSVYIIPINCKGYTLQEINFSESISYSELRILKTFLKSIKVVGYDLQFDLSIIKYQWKIQLTPYLDILILARLCQLPQTLRDLAYKINPSLLFINSLKEDFKYEDLMSSENISVDLSDISTVYSLALTTLFPLIIKSHYSSSISKNQKIIDLEMKFLEYIVDTQINGFNLDIKKLKDLKSNLQNQITSKQNDLNNYADKSCRISSYKELSSFLVDDLGLSSNKLTTKGKQSFCLEALQNMKRLAKLPAQRVALDKVISLKESVSTLDFLDRMENSIKGNKLWFQVEQLGYYGHNRVITKGCVLNHMPDEVQRCLIPSHGNKFVRLTWTTADFYTFCYLASCNDLLDSYSKGEDLFQAVASKVFNYTLQNEEQRTFIKVLVYSSIFYYDASFIAEKLGCSVFEATSLRDQFFSHYPELLRAANKILEEYNQFNYVTTLYGRILYITQTDNLSQESYIKLRGEVIKAKVQGTVVDFFKLAVSRARDIDDIIYKYGFTDSHLMETSIYNYEDFFGDYMSNFSDIVPNFSFQFKINFL